MTSCISFPPILATTILGDNQGALALVVNPTLHAHTKYIHVRQQHIQEHVNE